jgi:predicted kinase
MLFKQQWLLLVFNRTHMQALIFCGIQGSGKSTFYVRHFFNTHIRISMDLLRTRYRESLFLSLCLRTQARFVVDNTNPTPEERQRYIQPAKASGYELFAYFFNVAPENALRRNALRSGKEKIPEIGIQATLKRLQPPSFEEGFNHIFYVYSDVKDAFHIEEKLRTT